MLKSKRPSGRIEVEADDIAHLVDEQRIVGSLNVWLRCGCKLNVHIRRIVLWEKPVSAAIERSDQWVASAGVVRKVLDHGRNLIVIDASRPARTSLRASVGAAQDDAAPLGQRSSNPVTARLPL